MYFILFYSSFLKVVTYDLVCILIPTICTLVCLNRFAWNVDGAV